MTISRLSTVALVALCIFALLVSAQTAIATVAVSLQLTSIVAAGYYVRRYWNSNDRVIFAMVVINALAIGAVSALMVVRLCG